MSRWVLVVGSVLASLVVAITALLLLVDPNDYKADLEALARQNGVSLELAGALDWSLFPGIGFSVAEARVVMPAKPDEPVQSVRVQALSLDVGLLPLLGGNLQVNSLDISGLAFFEGDKQTLFFGKALLRVAGANNRGEPFPVEFHVDDTRITGTLAFQVKDVPQVSVDLHGDTINLDRYSAASADAPAAAEAPAAGAPGPDSQKSSRKAEANKQDEPLPFAALLQAQGKYRLLFDQMVVNHLALAQVVFDASVEPDQVVVHAFDAQLYQGSVKNRAVIALPEKGRPVLSLEMAVQQVALSPLVADATQEAPAVSAGVLNFESRLQGEGETPRQILQTLSGTAQASIDGLVLAGMNLEKQACEAAAQAQKKDMPAQAWTPQTTFRDLQAAARLKNGVARIDPLTARLDTVNLEGQGPVNLLHETLDLELDVTVLDKPGAPNHCEAIGSAVRDIAWPVRCQGSYRGALDNLCGVDKGRLAKLVGQIAVKHLKDGGGNFKDALDTLFQ